MRVPSPGRALLLCAMALAGLAACRAQAPQAILPQPLPGLKDVSVSEYRAHLQQLRGVVQACARAEGDCDAARVGEDDRVRPAAGAPYVERYGWLRTLLTDRNDPTHSHRAEKLPHALERLNQQEAEIDTATVPQVLADATKARRSAILARGEFRATEGYSIMEKVTGWIGNLLDRFFGGFQTLGRVAPWIGKALQWGLLVLAAVLLVLWAIRALDRSRIALGRLVGDTERRAAEQEAESRAWAERARLHAERGEWRDAVHALYWASIVALEDRRSLRRSNTRTPREAVRLIDAASHLRGPLQAQTDEFERIWYGNRPAEPLDYASALTHFQVLQAGSRRAAA